MTGEDIPLHFLDEPRAQLDRSLMELVDRAQEVLHAQGRLRTLLRANRAVAEQLDLPTVLRRIVEAALQLVDAQFGGLGVISPTGTLEQFIHVGMTPEQAEAIGRFPEGLGLLAAVTEHPHPIVLDDLRADVRSVGLPNGHPTMGSFLGVPIRVRGEVYGNLYLTNSASGHFDEEDEQLVVALAATAGAAIDNARLYSEMVRRQGWMQASADVTAALLSDESPAALGVLATRVLALAGARLVCVVGTSDDPAELVIRSARGEHEVDFDGIRFASEGSFAGRVLVDRVPQLLDRTDTRAAFGSVGRQFGPTMLVPLCGSKRTLGVLVVFREVDDPPFTSADLDLAVDFAAQASVAMELGEARDDSRRVAVLEDRGRIARDLHDHVVQQIFAAGLELQSVAGTLPAGREADHVDSIINSLDGAIAQIRTVIFALSTRPDPRRGSTRHRVIDIANEFSGVLASVPQVNFAGPVDLVVTGGLEDDLLAVLRESLSNVAQHASAEHVVISVSVRDGFVHAEITDDGRGLLPDAARGGLVNLAERALGRGGRFEALPGGPGTSIHWTVPYDSEGER